MYAQHRNNFEPQNKGLSNQTSKLKKNHYHNVLKIFLILWICIQEQHRRVEISKYETKKRIFF